MRSCSHLELDQIDHLAVMATVASSQRIDPAKEPLLTLVKILF